MIGQRRKVNYERIHLSPLPLHMPMQGSKFICDLFEYYNKQNIFILIEVICQTQKPKFLMSNFPWKVMIAQNSREYLQSVNGIYRLCSMLLATMFLNTFSRNRRRQNCEEPKWRSRSAIV